MTLYRCIEHTMKDKDISSVRYTKFYFSCCVFSLCFSKRGETTEGNEAVTFNTHNDVCME